MLPTQTVRCDFDARRTTRDISPGLPLNFKEHKVKDWYGRQFRSTAQDDDSELRIQGNVDLEEDDQVLLQLLVQAMKAEGGSRPAHSSSVIEDGLKNEHSLRYVQRMASLTVDAVEGMPKDPVQFSLEWPELVEMGRVLLRKLVERMAFVEFDVVKLAEIVVC